MFVDSWESESYFDVYRLLARSFNTYGELHILQMVNKSWCLIQPNDRKINIRRKVQYESQIIHK